MTEPELSSDAERLARLVAVGDRDVVDVGCGAGELVRWLDRAGARALGLEVSEAKVRAARQAGDGSGARFALGRGEALGLPDRSQDVVVYLRSLHHVPIEAMDRALAEACRVLRDDGLLYVVEPLAQGALFAMIELVDDESAVRAAARAALDRAASHGLQVVRSATYDVAGRYGSLDDVRRQMTAVDPARGAIFDARRAELAPIFKAGGRLLADGVRELRQSHRVDLFRVAYH